MSLIAVFTNLTIPNTPPMAKGQKGSVIDAFGLRTLELMKDKNFAIFIVFSFLSMIPFAMYFSFFSEFLLNINTKYISVTMNWGVLAEMGFLLLIPVAIKKFGLRKVMILGLVALVVRYLSFYAGGVINQSWMFYIGILSVARLLKILKFQEDITGMLFGVLQQFAHLFFLSFL